jgi:hypothetical protein
VGPRGSVSVAISRRAAPVSSVAWGNGRAVAPPSPSTLAPSAMIGGKLGDTTCSPPPSRAIVRVRSGRVGSGRSGRVGRVGGGLRVGAAEAAEGPPRRRLPSIIPRCVGPRRDVPSLCPLPRPRPLPRSRGYHEVRRPRRLYLCAGSRPGRFMLPSAQPSTAAARASDQRGYGPTAPSAGTHLGSCPQRGPDGESAGASAAVQVEEPRADQPVRKTRALAARATACASNFTPSGGSLLPPPTTWALHSPSLLPSSAPSPLHALASLAPGRTLLYFTLLGPPDLELTWLPQRSLSRCLAKVTPGRGSFLP